MSQFAKFKQVLNLGKDKDDQQNRCWPISPDDFDEIVMVKHFTNGADVEVVKSLFRKMSVQQLSSVDKLNYTGTKESMMKTPTVRDALRLGHCLTYCKSLVELRLTKCGFDTSTAATLFEQMREGTLPELVELALNDNALGDDGLSALLAARSRGAMPKLKKLRLARNQITVAGIQALTSSDLRSIVDLDLAGNDPATLQTSAAKPAKEMLSRALSTKGLNAKEGKVHWE